MGLNKLHCDVLYLQSGLFLSIWNLRVQGGDKHCAAPLEDAHAASSL